MPTIEAPGLEEAPAGFEPVEPGIYKVRITGCELTESKMGKPMVNWEFELFGEDLPDGYVGRKVFTNTLLAQENLWALKKLLTAANVRRTGDEFDTEDALGKELRVRVTQRVWEGTIRSQVRDTLPLE